MTDHQGGGTRDIVFSGKESFDEIVNRLSDEFRVQHQVRGLKIGKGLQLQSYLPGVNELNKQ